MGTGKEVQNWGDPAMYHAEEIASDTGPSVTLVSMTADPLGEIARVAMTYEGRFPASSSLVTESERMYYFNEVKRNVLEAPLEFVTMNFLITGVTRSFTHQLVRQRSAAYAQESMRFAVKDPLPTALPPSLRGTVPWRQWEEQCAEELYPKGTANTPAARHLIKAHAEKRASKQQIWRREWDEAIRDIGTAYNALIDAGMPAEDARGLAPHATLTQVNYHTSLRHLKDHAGLRLCSQAQAEWKAVWAQILNAIIEYSEAVAHNSERWQYAEIVDLFKPVCYAKGRCAFMADGDRYCSIRDKVEAYAAEGIPSSKWKIDLREKLYNNPNAAIPPRIGGDWTYVQGPKK